MLSYYPPMSGEDDPIVFPPDHIRGHRPSSAQVLVPPDLGWEFDGSSGFGDDTGTQICDVKNGNLVNCRPYEGASAHGWEFDGSSGFGGGHSGGGGGGGHPSSGGAPPSSAVRPSTQSTIATSPTSRNAATLAAAVASVAHPMASPSQRTAVGQSAGHAANAHQAGSFRAPRTTRGFVDAQRSSYGRQFNTRGYGYAGSGLAPRPWNDPYYNFGPTDGFYDDQVYYADDASPDWDSADMEDDPNFNGDFMKEVRGEVSKHKPEVLGASLAAVGGYVYGPIGAAAGGIIGYIGGKVLGL
jgi:hypothetical protein